MLFAEYDRIAGSRQTKLYVKDILFHVTRCGVEIPRRELEKEFTLLTENKELWNELYQDYFPEIFNKGREERRRDALRSALFSLLRAIAANRPRALSPGSRPCKAPKP